MKTRITGFLVLLIALAAGWLLLIPEPVPEQQGTHAMIIPVESFVVTDAEVSFNWECVAQETGVTSQQAEIAYEELMSLRNQYDSVIGFFNDEATDAEYKK